MPNSGRDRTAAIVYAVGWTQHTTGVQIIRTAAIMQLLLGNIGRPGGGIMAMRGHASIQGSTDIPTLYNLLPGYLPQPARPRDHGTLEGYFEQEKVDHGVWSSFPKYMISLLKAWYGDAATPDNEWGFAWVPRITATTRNCRSLSTWPTARCTGSSSSVRTQRRERPTRASIASV